MDRRIRRKTAPLVDLDPILQDVAKEGFVIQQIFSSQEVNHLMEGNSKSLDEPIEFQSGDWGIDQKVDVI